MSEQTTKKIFAIADVCFRVPNRPHPDLDAQENYCNFEMPASGDTIWLNIQRYNSIIEAPFWAFYEHWSTFNNGMADAPEDLDSARLIRCEQISPFEPSEYKNNYGEPSGLFQVRCLEVLELPSILTQFPASEELFRINLNDDNRFSRYNSLFRRSEITFYTGGTEGIGWYAIATNAHPRRLILSGFFLGRDDQWEICNRPIEIIGDEDQFIQKMAAKAQQPPPPPAFCRIDQRPD